MTQEEKIAQLLTITPEVQALSVMIEEDENRRKEFYEKAKRVSLKTMLSHWLEAFDNKDTRKSYERIMKILFDDKTLEYGMTVIDLQLTRAPQTKDWILEKIENIPDISDQQKEYRQDVYISFTKYLHAMTGGWFKRAYKCSCGFRDDPMLGDYYGQDYSKDEDK